MPRQVFISDQTVVEMVDAMFANHKGANLAKMAVKFIIQQSQDEKGADTSTLKNFVDFLISKGYN